MTRTVASTASVVVVTLLQLAVGASRANPPLVIRFWGESRFDGLRAVDPNGDVQRRVARASESACRVWTTATQRIRQTSTVNGCTLCVSQLAEILGMCERDCRAIASLRHNTDI